MNLTTHAYPWWIAPALVLLLAVNPFAEVYLGWRVPLAILFAAVLLLFVGTAKLVPLPGNGRLQALVAPLPVFAVTLDGGSRSVLEKRAGSSVAGYQFFLVTNDEGLEFWKVARQPVVVASIPAIALVGAEVDIFAHRNPALDRTVQIRFEDNQLVLLEVSRLYQDAVRHRGPSAQRLYNLLNEHLTPAQPDAAHTQPRAQTD